MYNLYGRYIGKRIFNLTLGAGVPAVEMEDGVNYLPTKEEAAGIGMGYPTKDGQILTGVAVITWPLPPS